MNKKRKAQIAAVITQLEGCIDTLNDINFDETYARDNIPENLQGGEAYSQSEDCSDVIEDATDSIRDAIDSLRETT